MLRVLVGHDGAGNFLIFMETDTTPPVRAGASIQSSEHNFYVENAAGTATYSSSTRGTTLCSGVTADAALSTSGFELRIPIVACLGLPSSGSWRDQKTTANTGGNNVVDTGPQRCINWRSG